MTTDYKNEGNKIITIQKIFIENSEGERDLVETRTRTGTNNQNWECPPHDMTKIGNNLYKCKKCNITRYGEEENFNLVKNNHEFPHLNAQLLQSQKTSMVSTLFFKRPL